MDKFSGNAAALSATRAARWLALLGVAFALSLAGATAAWAAGGATAGNLTAGATEGAASAYFTVYVQKGADGAPEVAKAYSQEQFEAISPQHRAPVSGLYWESSGTAKVATSTCYVTLDELVEDAGIADCYVDSTQVKAIDAVSSPIAIPTKADLEACTYFYSNVGSAEVFDDTATKVPAVIARLSASAQVGSGGTLTAGQTQDYLAQDKIQGRNSGTRFIWGISPEQLADKSARGNRLWSNMVGVVFIVDDGNASGDAGGSEAAVPVAPQVIPVSPLAVSAKTVKVKAVQAKKKAIQVKAAKAFKVSGAKGKVTFKKLSGKAKIKVASNGKVTIKKGCKKGTYKVKVAVTDAGNAKFRSVTRTVTLKIKIK